MRVRFIHGFARDLGAGAVATYAAGCEYEIDNDLGEHVTRGLLAPAVVVVDAFGDSWPQPKDPGLIAQIGEAQASANHKE